MESVFSREYLKTIQEFTEDFFFLFKDKYDNKKPNEPFFRGIIVDNMGVKKYGNQDTNYSGNGSSRVSVSIDGYGIHQENLNNITNQLANERNGLNNSINNNMDNRIIRHYGLNQPIGRNGVTNIIENNVNRNNNYNISTSTEIFLNLIGNLYNTQLSRQQELAKLKTIYLFIHFHHYYDNNFIPNQDAYIINDTSFRQNIRLLEQQIERSSNRRKKTIKVIHFHHYHVYKESEIKNYHANLMSNSTEFTPLSLRASTNGMYVPGYFNCKFDFHNPSNAHQIVEKRYGILVYESFELPPPPSNRVYDSLYVPSTHVPLPQNIINNNVVEINLTLNDTTVTINLFYYTLRTGNNGKFNGSTKNNTSSSPRIDEEEIFEQYTDDDE